MSELVSTQDVPVRWADEVHADRDRADTRYFLFAHELGHLVVHETVQEEGGVSDAAATGGVTTSKNSLSVGRSLRVPRAKTLSSRPDDRYILLKKYEGFVSGRSNDGFSARLFETAGDYPALEAEFDLEELSETDRELAVEGAPLVWTIGYRYDGSTRKRESVIYLRRLPAWSAAEVAQAKKATEELTRDIAWQ